MEPSSPPAETADLVVVIPTFNERDNIDPLLRSILALSPRFRAVVVDDNSPDGTGRLADEIAKANPGHVHVIHRPSKQGIGPAYLAGFAEALTLGAALVAQMDADLSHDPADLVRLVAATDSADLVLGSRYVVGGSTRGWPMHRRLISRFGGAYARLVLGVPVADLTGGFKVYRRSALAALDLGRVRSDGYSFQIETTYRALRRGLSVREVPITFTDRVAGKSKLSRRIVLEAVIVVWRLRFDRSIR